MIVMWILIIGLRSVPFVSKLVLMDSDVTWCEKEGTCDACMQVINCLCFKFSIAIV